jgi:hypothetical protein
MIEQAAPANAYAVVEVSAERIVVEGFKSCPDSVMER